MDRSCHPPPCRCYCYPSGSGYRRRRCDRRSSTAWSALTHRKQNPQAGGNMVLRPLPQPKSQIRQACKRAYRRQRQCRRQRSLRCRHHRAPAWVANRQAERRPARAPPLHEAFEVDHPTRRFFWRALATSPALTSAASHGSRSSKPIRTYPRGLAGPPQPISLQAVGWA